MWLQSVLEAEQAVTASLEQVRSVLDTAPVDKGWLQAQLQDTHSEVKTHIWIAASLFYKLGSTAV